MGEMRTYVPEVQSVPDIPEVPEVPDSPEVPEISDTPEVSETVEPAEGQKFAEDQTETPAKSDRRSSEALEPTTAVTTQIPPSIDLVQQPPAVEMAVKSGDNAESQADPQYVDVAQKQPIDTNLVLPGAIESAIDRVGEPSDLSSKSSRKHLYNDSVGTLGEELAVKTTGGVSLDSTIINNFENYDLINTNEIASVKSHIVGNEKTAMGNYAQDLRGALGLLEEHKLDVATERLWEVKNDPGKWEQLGQTMPAAVCDAASLEEMKESLKATSCIRVPADHVGKVQEYLDRVVPKDPELYGIPPDASQEEIASRLTDLKSRVRPIAEGVTAHDMRIAAKEIYQRKMEKNLDDVMHLPPNPKGPEFLRTKEFEPTVPVSNPEKKEGRNPPKGYVPYGPEHGG
jgi:hypothetical protein